MAMRITSKGQVTIPADIREKAGLLPHTEVEFQFDGMSVRIVRAGKQSEHGRIRRLIDRLRGSATVRMTTDEVVRLSLIGRPPFQEDRTVAGRGSSESG